MPNLDVKVLRYMSNDEFRVLTAVEMGMKNHEIVPSSLIEAISGLKRGGAFKLIRSLAKNKLVGHQSKPYDGYRLTSKGYDYLALKTLCKRGAIAAVGIQIGVGKESDIFTAVRPDGEEVAIKLHKLGRSFRTLKKNRDYTRPGQSFNWLYMSRLSALKEFAFMSALHAKGFDVPTPIDVNRHVVVMSLAHGYQLNAVQVLRNPATVFSSLMELICSLASYGLIHCDFNEFNMLIDDEEKVTLIDFPQMVSTSHSNAEYYFNRDVECVRAFFKRRYGFEAVNVPTLEADTCNKHELDKELAASGWTPSQAKDFQAVNEAMAQGDEGEAGEEEEEEEESDEEERGEEGEEEGDEAEGGEVERQPEEVKAPAGDATVLQRAPAAVTPVHGSQSGGAEASSAGGGEGGATAEQAPAAAAAVVEAAAEEGPSAVAGGVVACEALLGASNLNEEEDELPLHAPNRSVPVHSGQARTAGEMRASNKATGAKPGAGGPVCVADRVKQELRRKNSLRQAKGGSRNEVKNREARKIASSVKRELNGTSGW